jgi:NADH:ubiquinone oxidoreductase subunit H
MSELGPSASILTGPPRLWAVAQAVAWVLLFLSMALGRKWLETWLLSRFQRRDPRRVTVSALWSAGFVRTSMAQVMALLAGLLAGAAIPLLPQFQIQGWPTLLPPLSTSSVGLLYVLAMDWCSVGLLAHASPGCPLLRNAVARSTTNTQILAAVPVMLVVLSLVITTGMLHSWQEGTLNLSTMLALQGGWTGLRWLVVLQPLACILWMVCAAPLSPDPRLRPTLAWQVQALNRVLLTTVLFMGGWQGPLADRCPGLGLLYTVAKGALITFVWVWISSSRPFPSLTSSSQSTWRLCASLAGLNLLVTALLATVQTPLSGLGVP